jgi:hypothetical protein
VSSTATVHQTRLASNRNAETPVQVLAEQRPSVVLPRITLFAVAHLVIPETHCHLADLLHHQLVNEYFFNPTNGFNRTYLNYFKLR